MAFDHEKRDALRMLHAIELGTMTTSEASAVFDQADPTLVYFIFTWLRKRYREHPAAEGVLGRLADLCNSHRSLTRKAKEGQADSIVGWFEGTYSYKDLEAEAFIDIIVEKLEG